MPLTLKQLKEKRNIHAKKIEEHKAVAKAYGSLREEIRFNPEYCFQLLPHESLEQVNSRLTLYPRVQEILKCIHKATKEEKKRM